MFWGLHCAPFVPLLGTFGASLGHLGQFWDTLWDTWGCTGESWGCSGGILGQHWTFGVHRRPLRKPKALKYRACAQKQACWNLHGGPGGPGDDGETVHELQFRTYPPHAPGIRMT